MTITDEEIQDIKRAWDNDKSATDICKEFRRSMKTVYDIVKGIYTRTSKPRAARLTAEEAQEIVKLYREGLTLTEICHKTGHSLTSCWRTLCRENVERRPRGRKKGNVDGQN